MTVLLILRETCRACGANYFTDATRIPRKVPKDADLCKECRWLKRELAGIGETEAAESVAVDLGSVVDDLGGWWFVAAVMLSGFATGLTVMAVVKWMAIR